MSEQELKHRIALLEATIETLLKIKRWPDDGVDREFRDGLEKAYARRTK
jgi:hypothetical protein